MAVGLSPIWLSDVITEIGSGSSLGDCFNNAYADGFDGNYSGNKDRLSNFQNYNHRYMTIYPSSTPTLFTYDGNVCSAIYYTIDATHSWYVIVDSNEITGLYFDPMTGTDTNSAYFSCNSTNPETWTLGGQADFFWDSDDSWAGGIGASQYPYGTNCP